MITRFLITRPHYLAMQHWTAMTNLTPPATPPPMASLGPDSDAPSRVYKMERQRWRRARWNRRDGDRDPSPMRPDQRV